MKSHLFRIFMNKRSLIIFSVIIAIPIFDFITLYIQKVSIGTTYHPMFGAFLSGASEGHIPQIYLLWYLPLYLLILCADDYIQDVQYGYNKILISSMGKKRYIREKLLTSFIVCGGTMFIGLTINMILSSVFFNGGNFSFGIFDMEIIENKLFTVSQIHPFLAYFIFLLNTSLFSGLVGSTCTAICLLFPLRKIAYPISFFVWYIQVTIQGGSIIDITQPFTEYDFNHFIPIWVRSFLVFAIIPIISFIYKVKTDEI